MYIEIWKWIPGYEGYYMVSTHRRVKSLNYRGNTGKTKILKQSTDRNGYKKVGLRKNSKVKVYLVHRLVAQAFIPNPNNLSEVNHKDENKTNNAVWNLEYCTHEYNINYGTGNKRRSEAHKGKHYTNKTISKRRQRQQREEQRQQQLQQLIQLTLDIYNKCNKDCK